MKVQVADYKLFDYELVFLKEEIERFGGKVSGEPERGASLEVKGLSLEDALNLTYTKGVRVGSKFIPSVQRRRELNDNGKRTQAKRYGPHSLHEYKGRFNPQMPRSLLISNFRMGDTVLDPFMGSGTTLVESRRLGITSYGVELNHLAFLLALSKKYYEEVEEIPEIEVFRKNNKIFFKNEIKDYLKKWFPQDQLRDLESILIAIDTSRHSKKQKLLLKVILSDLLREHSLQDPRDLRIRRREEVPKDKNLLDNFLESLECHRTRHKRWIKEFGTSKVKSYLLMGNSTQLSQIMDGKKIDGTVSSPPYASALPYIDTYRLSMIALDLIKPKDIVRTEKSLIGARDINNADKECFDSSLENLPLRVIKTIKYIKKEISEDAKAGFRKRAVPYFLNNYCNSMLGVLRELIKIETDKAINRWVLGPNKIKLDGEWFYINTPEIVGELAEAAGYKKVGVKAVQAYPRYHIHSKNSINKESVLIFEK